MAVGKVIELDGNIAVRLGHDEGAPTWRSPTKRVRDYSDLVGATVTDVTGDVCRCFNAETGRWFYVDTSGWTQS